MNRSKIHGHVKVETLSEAGKRELLFEKDNQIQDDYAEILSRILAGDPAARMNTLYIEYENMPSDSDTVTVSSFPTTDGAEYYTNLSGNKNFIRHAMVLKPEAKDGAVTFSAVLGSDSGFLEGNAIGAGTHSRLYSMALVCGHPTDQTQDFVFARTNWDVQKIKTTEAVYIAWTITFDT